ncbi:MAG: tetratricopeptide repeat protein [Planctomyces sp.]|jgi:tetratricopeptide (TPR) repeat protein
MSHRRRKFSIPAVRKWFRSTTGYYQRKISKWATEKKRSWRETFRVRDSQVAVGGSDRRKLPTGLSYVNPLFWIVQFGTFVFRFLQTRQAGNFLFGIPSVLGLALPVAVNLFYSPGLEEQVSRARTMVNRTVAEENLELAEFYSRQLSVLLPDSPDVGLARAEILERMERRDEARKLAADVAFQREYLPAAMWLARNLFDDFFETAFPDAATEQSLENVLTWILQRERDNPDACYIKGIYHFKRGQNQLAAEMLKKVTEKTRSIPDAFYWLAVIEYGGQNFQQARTAAGTAADMLKERLAVDGFDSKLFQQLGRMLIIAEREDEAVRLVLELARSNPEVQQAAPELLLNIYLEHSRRLRLRSTQSATDVALAVDQVTRALSLAPNDRRVTEELIAVAGLKQVDEVQLEEQLQAALGAGISPGIVNFILGTRAMTRTPPDLNRAMTYFDLAMAQEPGMPGLLNNVADAIAESAEPDLEKALSLVQEAFRFLPDQPHLFDTRGKIYLKQGQLKLAIADFERALAEPELRPAVHAKLAEAWEKLGDSQKAALHRTTAEKLSELRTQTAPVSP